MIERLELTKKRYEEINEEFINRYTTPWFTAG